MFYYAVLDGDEYVLSVTQSATEIVADNHVAITAEQYADSTLIGKRYDVRFNIFEDAWWTGNAWEVQYKDTPNSVDFKLDRVDESIAALQEEVAGKANGEHNHDDRYFTESEINATVANLNNAINAKANASAIPTKTSQLTNDSGFKTTDNNTTYTLSKSGSTITLTGSDGSSTSVSDADTNTTYTLSSFGITATAAELNKMDGVTATTAELNYVDGVTSNIQTQLNGKAASSHTHDYVPTSGGDVSGNLNVNGVLKVNGQQAFYYQASTASQTVGTNNATGGTTIAGGADSTTAINGALLKTATVIPRSTNTYYCGNANFRWKGIYSAAAVNVSSDERLKENIVKLHADEAVDFINTVDVCSFNYIGDDSEQVGVMAQDVLAKAPNLAKALVTQDENGYYGVKTSDLVFPLIIAVQELTKQVKELKGE